jgi:hypothetical protein
MNSLAHPSLDKNRQYAVFNPAKEISHAKTTQ